MRCVHVCVREMNSVYNILNSEKSSIRSMFIRDKYCTKQYSSAVGGIPAYGENLRTNASKHCIVQ